MMRPAGVGTILLSLAAFATVPCGADKPRVEGAPIVVDFLGRELPPAPAEPAGRAKAGKASPKARS